MVFFVYLLMPLVNLMDFFFYTYACYFRLVSPKNHKIRRNDKIKESVSELLITI